MQLDDATIQQLQDRMATGALTSRQLVESCLARIQTVDRAGPRLASIVEINPDALRTADRLDEERRVRGARGPLHGIPVLLKDNIDTADGMLTTAGSLALLGSRPRADAFIVTRLRDAGVVILGKTNLSEWANFRSERSSSGWSARGGQTRNAYAPERNPCGSSSGSAVAVAAGLAVVAVGTETDGSIVCPAAVNGIVGIKPMVGLVSRTGIIPISISQDTAGPMARTVADAAVLLGALAGSDPADPTTQKAARAMPDHLAELKRDGMKGARIGVVRSLGGLHEGVHAVFEAAVRELAGVGAVLVDPADLTLRKSLPDDELTVLLYEFKDGLNRYLTTRAGVPQTLAELIEFNEREREREMPYFGQELFLMAQEKGALTEREYLRARTRAKRAAGRDGIDAVLRKHNLDAIVAPNFGPAWMTDLVNGDHFLSGMDPTRAAAVAGYPHITVPAGFVHDLPVGISFIGAAWSEPTLIRLAHAFEQATHSRRPPRFPTR